MTQENRTYAALIVIAGNTTFKAVRIKEEGIIIGRELGDIILNNQEISSSHCQIKKHGSHFYIFDMNSTNGTFVNGKRTLKEKLCDQDMISIGSIIFRFELLSQRAAKEHPLLHQVMPSKRGEGKSPAETVSAMIKTPEIDHHSKICIRYGDGSTEVINLAQKITYLGRSNLLKGYFEDSRISRRHAAIKIANTGELFIEDLGSTHGTILNDQIVRGIHKLKPNDCIKIGQTEIIILEAKVALMLS